MKTIPAFFLFAVLLLTSCNKDDDQTANFDEIFELEFAETKDVENIDYKISFTELIEESRCPADAICVWEGRAVVQVQLQVQEAIFNYELATFNSIDLDSLKTFTHDEYTIELMEVNPYPGNIGQQANEEDYSIELRITKE